MPTSTGPIARRSPAGRGRTDALLVLNAGSSSLKFSVFVGGERPERLLRGQIDGLLTQARFEAHDGTGIVGSREWPAGTRLGHEGAIAFLLSWGGHGVMGDHQIGAVGHRIVHGGTRFSAPALIDAAVLSELESLIPLAPLHQPHNVAAVKAVSSMTPGLPQVACFDTAFHRTMPPVAQSFALPRHFADEGIRRYGFHGLSYEHVAGALGECDLRAAGGRVIAAHLGNGASLCALRAGQSIATTMGLTALDGLVMGTRCGSIDPGVLLYLLQQRQLGGDELERLLYEKSGLLGVSGISSDMRDLLASADPRAAEAIDLFVYRVGREVGSLAAALGGVDSLVFTGGIGEHATEIRRRVCLEAAWLGLQLDEEANAEGGPRISSPGSAVSAWIIPADEDATIARHAYRVLNVRERSHAYE